jgi:alginate O-acetyltransferase complex protein AlgI
VNTPRILRARPPWRPGLLLLVSCFFYVAVSSLAGLGLFTCLILATYLLGRLIARQEGPPRRLALWAGVGLNLGAMVVVKYTSASSGELVSGLEALQSAAVVVGLSYYSLQAVGYLVDVFHDRCGSQSDAVTFSLSFLFFPKVLQGPIERIGALLPRMRNPASVTYQDMRLGLVTAGLGLGKKVIIADTLGRQVNAILATPAAHSGLPVVLAVYGFALQILFDFSGYSDIAVGIARCLGIELIQNFDRPYWSTSVAEFWRRWHISLSSWLRDFIFLPLAYGVSSLSEKVGMSQRLSDHMSYAAAAGATMLACGLWHGATGCFLAWGAFHGAALIVGRISGPFRRRLWKTTGLHDTPLKRSVSVAFTFHLVVFSWILFRAASFSEVRSVVTNLTGPLSLRGASGGADPAVLVAVYLLTAVVLLLDPGCGSGGLALALTRRGWLVRWVVYVAVALCVLAASQAGHSSAFIYGRF